MAALLSPHFRKRALDLGLYGQSDYTSFVILGRSRVGSNLLRGLLNSNPEIAVFGEVFRDHASMDWDHTGYFGSSSAHSRLQDDPVDFVASRLLGGYPSGLRAIGFKLFYYHAREGRQAGVWPYLQGRKDLKVVHLKRRNLLKTHLSRKRAALTDSWVDTTGQAGEADPVRLSYSECLEDFIQTRTWEEDADRYFADHPKLTVEYEALASDFQSEGNRIQEFLNLEPRALTPTTFRQLHQTLDSSIVNYHELKRRFAGSPWERFFVD